MKRLNTAVSNAFNFFDGKSRDNWISCVHLAYLAHLCLIDRGASHDSLIRDERGISLFERKFAVVAFAESEDGLAQMMLDCAYACDGYYGDFMQGLDTAAEVLLFDTQHDVIGGSV